MAWQKHCIQIYKYLLLDTLIIVLIRLQNIRGIRTLWSFLSIFQVPQLFKQWCQETNPCICSFCRNQLIYDNSFHIPLKILSHNSNVMFYLCSFWLWRVLSMSTWTPTSRPALYKRLNPERYKAIDSNSYRMVVDNMIIYIIYNLIRYKLLKINNLSQAFSLEFE
jgi:hypothetical protein